MTEREKQELLATVWMDMFCTGSTPLDEIEYYEGLADVHHEDAECPIVLKENLALLSYMCDHAELLFERAIQAVQEAHETS